MRIEEALELFRAVREEEIARYTEQRAGENHVPFPWLMRLALDPTSLSDIERHWAGATTHLETCGLCRRGLDRIRKKVEHPALPTLVAWTRGHLDAEGSREIGLHVEADGCRHCKVLLNSRRAAALEALLEAPAKLPRLIPPAEATGLALLPASVGRAAPSQAAFTLDASDDEGRLRARLMETDERGLRVVVRTDDPALAGATAHVEVVGEEKFGEKWARSLEADVTLAEHREGQWSGRHDFGTFAEAADRLGRSCVLLVWVDPEASRPSDRPPARGGQDEVVIDLSPYFERLAAAPRVAEESAPVRLTGAEASLQVWLFRRGDGLLQLKATIADANADGRLVELTLIGDGHAARLLVPLTWRERDGECVGQALLDDPVSDSSLRLSRRLLTAALLSEEDLPVVVESVRSAATAETRRAWRRGVEEDGVTPLIRTAVRDALEERRE